MSKRYARSTAKKDAQVVEAQGDDLDLSVVGSAETAQHLKSIEQEAKSSETSRSYAAALRYVDCWYQLRFGKDLEYPMSVGDVLTFIGDHFEAKVGRKTMTTMPKEVEEALVSRKVKKNPGVLKEATVRHRLAVMSGVHTYKVRYSDGQVNPFLQTPVVNALRNAKRALGKRGQQSKSKEALTRELLEAMLGACDEEGGLRGIRDKALLLFAFSSGGRRRSEVAEADMSTLVRKRVMVEGRSGKKRWEVGFVYQLTKSKTNQSGEVLPTSFKPVMGSAAEAMKEWLSASGIKEGPIFRGVFSKQGREVVGDARLSHDSIRRIVIRRAKQAGLEGALDGAFSAHSLRSGFVTQAGRKNIPMFEAMGMTDHKSVSMFARYYKVGSLEQAKAARLMDDEE